MSDKQPKQNDLKQFFNTQGKKKSQPAKTATEQVSNLEEAKHLTNDQKAELAQQAQTKKQNTNYESSDEEKTDITLAGDTASVIKDRKDVEAQKRKQLEQEQDSAKGWKALESQSSSDKTPFASSGGQKSQQSGPAVGQSKGASEGAKSDIKFTSAPPKFKKSQSKGQKINDDFPEIGSVTQQLEGKKAEEPVLSKKDSSQIGAFGSNAVGPRSDKPDYKDREQKPSQPEERKEAQKPVFTSSKKKTLEGGAAVEEIQNSKQNYDFTSLKVSASTNKVARPREEGAATDAPNDGEQKPRQRKEYNNDNSDNRTYKKQYQADSDEDFETVTEKKRNTRPRNPDQSSYGGKPSFTKGKN